MVEFAIVAVLFFSLLLGIMDFGRLLFTWNAAAAEATLGCAHRSRVRQAHADEVADGAHQDERGSCLSSATPTS